MADERKPESRKGIYAVLATIGTIAVFLVGRIVDALTSLSRLNLILALIITVLGLVAIVGQRLASRKTREDK
jgi:hypothetical protein